MQESADGHNITKGYHGTTRKLTFPNTGSQISMSTCYGKNCGDEGRIINKV